MSAERRGRRAVRHRPGRPAARQAGPHPPPAPVQGARREVLDAHRLRAVRRRDVRRGRHRRAPGRRLGVQQRLRQRDDGPDHRRRAAAPHPRRQPVGAPCARRRRPALRLLPGLAGAGLRHGRPLHEGGPRPLREARGRRRDGAPDHPAQPGRHPGDGPHRLHAAERARPRRLPRSRAAATRPSGCSPTPTPSRTPARSPS